jgi:hypothetical protein
MVALAAISPGMLMSLTNADRASQGVPALSENALLDEAAQMKADDMAAKGYYSHITPEGYTPFYWFQKVGYDYLDIGENLDLIYSGDETTVNNAWMGSSEHRANILLPQFTEIGAGVAEGKYQGIEGTFSVELFGTPMPPPSPLKPASAPAPAEHPVPPEMITASSSAAAPIAAVPTLSTPSWATFQIQYSPQGFAYLLQIFVLSIQESTRELLVLLSSGGVY